MPESPWNFAFGEFGPAHDGESAVIGDDGLRFSGGEGQDGKHSRKGNRGTERTRHSAKPKIGHQESEFMIIDFTPTDFTIS